MGNSGMENEVTKIFVGKISRETEDEDLRDHFQKYGTVLSSSVNREKGTGASRGFGFVQFSDSSAVDSALRDSHSINGRMVDVQRAVPRSEQQQWQQEQELELSNGYSNRNNGVGNHVYDRAGNNFTKDKKIFVGGLHPSLTKEEFRNYFEKFGRVVDVVVMQDSSTNRPRGFGFITFESEDSAVRARESQFHEINGRTVEVKKAVPKDEIDSKGSGYTRGGRSPSNISALCGSYVSYGTGYHVPSCYTTFPGWFPGYSYGTGAYVQGYPGFPTILPRCPWSGNMMTGPSMYVTPYNSYMNDWAFYNRVIAPNFYGYLHQIHGGNGHLLTTAAPSPSAKSQGGNDST